MATLQILVVWAKTIPSTDEKDRFEQTLSAASDCISKAFNQQLNFTIWGRVNQEEKGPIPMGIGFDESQDYVDADSAEGAKIAKIRDLYLDASNTLNKPKYVVFVLPSGDVTNANAFSLES